MKSRKHRRTTGTRTIMQSPPLAPGTLAVQVPLKTVALTALRLGQPVPVTVTVTEVSLVEP